MTPAAVALAHVATHPTLQHHPRGWLLALTGLVAGAAVGISGMGGGALMTPALVLLFKVDSRVAIASDLVSSLVMKPIGGGVHARRGTIHWGLVARLIVGSVPAAFVGAYTLNHLGGGGVKHIQGDVKTLLGWALLVACASLITKYALTARATKRRLEAGETINETPHAIKTAPTVLVGVVGGFMVGMTSVGSGSLMLVLLMLLYPRLSSRSLVGTDLVQAVPLVASAAFGQYVFGHIDFGLAGFLLLGAIPGVYLGARVSSRAPDGVVRPILVGVLAASALALLFANDNGGLAWALAIAVVVGLPLWAAVDATLKRSSDWLAAGRDRTRWVAVLGLGAPFGVGLLAAIPYFARVRRSVAAASARPDRSTSHQALRPTSR